MSKMSFTSLCAYCEELGKTALPFKPHDLLTLEDVRAPTTYGGLLERRYACSACAAVWLRRTRSDGTDLESELLAPRFP
jgi:hypothetical protein